MSKITYRQLDRSYEPTYGQGQANFLYDADAVAQAIQTRLLLFEGEWWENLADGLALWQRILGQGASLQDQQAIVLLIQQRILGTPYVTLVENVQFDWNSTTRSFQFYCVAQTQFGPVVVTNIPQTSNKGIS
jgi:hypothetical protein